MNTEKIVFAHMVRNKSVLLGHEPVLKLLGHLRKYTILKSESIELLKKNSSCKIQKYGNIKL